MNLKWTLANGLVLSGLLLFVEVISPLPARADDSQATAGAREETSPAQIFRQQARDYEAAFARGDAHSIAAMWAENGSYTDENGQACQGRAAIEDRFAQFFKTNGPAPLSIEVKSIKMIGPDCAIEQGFSSLTDAKGKALTSAPYTVVHVRHDGKWEIAMCSESAPNMVKDPAQALSNLEWLVGDWKARGSRGQARLSTRWAADKHCLISTFHVMANGTDHEDLMVIAFDSRKQGIVSYMFDSDGGTGRANWSKEGKRWLVDAHALTADGHLGRALNVFEPKDDGTFIWQSTNRTLDGASIPDSEKITAQKVSIEKE